MSITDGIIRMDMKENSRIINVLKHPKVAPAKIETPLTWNSMITIKYDPKRLGQIMEAVLAGRGKTFRTEVGDYVNIFWRNLVSWSGMLWDPKRFPTMAYELDKEMEFTGVRRGLKNLPWHMKLLFKFYMPKNFSKVKNAKKFLSFQSKPMEKRGMRVIEYMEDISKKDEYHLKFQDCGLLAGAFNALEKEERNWNVFETKCVGSGDPYCELKIVPGEASEMKDFLEGIDHSTVEEIHDRMTDQLMAFMIHNKPLGDRPRLVYHLPCYVPSSA